MSMTVEQLLATLGIDEVSVGVSASGRYVLIQRDPQPGEEGIAPDTDVEFMLVDLEGDPTDPALPPPPFNVTIEGSLALSFSGGVPAWSAPWSGTVTSHAVSSPFAFWKVVASQTPLVFDSEQNVDVQVDLIGAGGWGHGPWGHFPWGHPLAPPISWTFIYTFTIADLTPPTVVAAEGVDPWKVRITFDDEMATTGAGSVLDVSNWSGALIRWNVDPLPGVTLDVVAVAPADVSTLTVPIQWTYADSAARLAATGFGEEDEFALAFQVSDSSYWQLVGSATPTWREVVPTSQWDLTVNWEQTPGCRYQVTPGSSIEDDAGNTMDPVYGTAFFAGFSPDVPDLRRFSHWRHMVPLKNRIEDATRDLERFSNCIEEVLGWMLYSVDHFTDQFDPDRATDEQIDAMLYDMGNPFASWTELELTAIQRRKLLRILIEIYKAKGTAWGIEQTVFFLLGEVVTCVEYMAGGWVLGVDALGGSSVAEVMSDGWEPFDFTAVAAPWEMQIKVDSGAPQVVTFVPADFANPASATAAEVAAVISSQLVGGAAYPLFPGQPAVALGTGSEPFTVSPGDSLVVNVDGAPAPHQVVFATEDIAVPGAATAEELASRITEDLEGLAVGVDAGGQVAIESVVRGPIGKIQIVAGGTQVALGLPTTEQTGSDYAQISVYSEKAGVEAMIEVTGGSANAALAFDINAVGSTGGAVLAPDDSYTLYSFDIETENMLTSTQEAIVRRVAEYMRPAHTHLINIRTALPLPWPDGWMLGVDALDESTELAE